MKASRTQNWEEAPSPTMRSADWKGHYLSMEAATEGQEEFRMQTVPVIDSNPVIISDKLRRGIELANAHSKANARALISRREELVKQEPEITKDSKFKLSKADARTLLMIRQIIQERNNEKETQARAKDIRLVNPNAIGIKQQAIESRIARILFENKDGMHINDIIDALENSGWTSKSKYHKYSEIYNACSRHYYMFEKFAKAKFKLREAFVGKKPDKIIEPINKYSAKLTTFKDIVANVVKNYQEKDSMYPGKVMYILHHMGYNCSYDQVRDAMRKNKKLVKDGFTYVFKKNNSKNIES